MLIKFDEGLVTGYDMIDEQHKELIDRIAAFVAACEAGDSKVKAIKMLDYLDEYTNFHFSAEEKLQEEVNQPQLEAHKAKHAEFISTVKELFEFLEESEAPTDAFVEQVKVNVVDWLFSHIKTFDRAVAEYVLANK